MQKTLSASVASSIGFRKPVERKHSIGSLEAVPYRGTTLGRRQPKSSSSFFGTQLKIIDDLDRTNDLVAKSCVTYAMKQDSVLVAVTGATGLVGSRLVSKLVSEGARVKVLTRNVDRAESKLPYPAVQFVGIRDWETEICGCDAVVNLAGEPIATRWSPAIKDEIKRSRVETTKRVAKAINACTENTRPRVLISSSAIGYYGTSLKSVMVESSPNGDDYLAKICREWEAAALETKDRTRVVILRTGLVLAKEGGVLERMVPVFNLFAGGPLGSGQQWVSWIHREDLVNLILTAIKNEDYAGSYNATAPNPVRMGEFCNAVGRALGRPSWLPVPEFALQTLLGEGAMLVVEGQRVIPSKTQEAGFKFQFSDVTSALTNIL